MIKKELSKDAKTKEFCKIVIVEKENEKRPPKLCFRMLMTTYFSIGYFG